MAAQWQININLVVSPDTVKLPPARDVWDSLERRVSVDPSPPKVSFEAFTARRRGRRPDLLDQ